MSIGIIGGTGALGSGLALRCAAAGHEVMIGSRDADRGAVAATDPLAQLGERGLTASLRAADNETAAAFGGDVRQLLGFRRLPSRPN